MSDNQVGQSTVKSLYRSFIKNNQDVVYPNLKTFARNLKRNGTDDEKLLATTWFANKSGLLERTSQKERLKNKGGRIALEKAATKQARKKKVGSGKAATATTTATK